MADLEADLRKVMAPHTAPRLRESKRNVLRDFVHIAGPLGVTHFLILTATQHASYLRITKSPRVRAMAGRVSCFAMQEESRIIEWMLHTSASSCDEQCARCSRRIKCTVRCWQAGELSCALGDDTRWVRLLVDLNLHPANIKTHQVVFPLLSRGRR